MSDPKDFFISYNKADREWAEWIAWKLEEAGYTTVIQAWDFVPGSNFVGEMNRGLEQASRLIAVLSPAYLAAHFTQPEWHVFFAQDPEGYKRKLVTVRVREFPKKNLLGQIVHIDLVGLSEEEARKVLLEGVKLGRKKPDTPVPFPAAVPETAPSFPGDSPPMWNVPHQRNRNFTGREDLLAGMRGTLTAGNPGGLAVAITGLGGKGKTQLALEYVYRHAADYSLVWWLRAATGTTLDMDYAALAPQVGVLPALQSDPREVIPAVLRALAARDKWLLVFDNAEEPAAVKDYVPQGNGSVIITSRNHNWRAMAEPIAIAVWEPDEAADFLIKRTGSKDREAAKKLGEELGFLPLALEQAGAYIEATGCSFAEYLELFRVHRQALLEKGKPATDYPDTVATTWEISFRKLEETTPLAADLMIICAFLAPNDIPFDIFSEAAEKLPEPMQEKVNDPLEFKNALAALRRFSLAEVGQDALSVHRLVQMVARDRMGENGQKEWAGIALRLIDAVYKFEEHDLNTWKRAERLLTHGMTAVEVEYDVLKTEAQKAMSSLCNEIGLHLQTFGGFDEAGRQLERALVIDEKTYGPDHPNVATSLSNLGLVLKDLGDLEGAKVRIERALAMYRKFFGEDHPKTQLVLENLKVLGPAR